MMNGKKIFRFCAFLISLTSIVLCMIHCPRYWELFSFFTIQSNVLCLIMFTFNLKKESPPLFRGLVTVCITLTFLVFHFLLRPAGLTMDNLGNLANMSTTFAHYLVPACIWTEYIFFSEKGKMKLLYPFIWIIYPLLYVAYILLIYKPMGGTFLVDGKICNVPYFFLDTAALGAGGVAIWCVVIAFGFLIMSYLFLLLDRLLSR